MKVFEAGEVFQVVELILDGAVDGLHIAVVVRQAHYERSRVAPGCDGDAWQLGQARQTLLAIAAQPFADGFGRGVKEPGGSTGSP